MRAIMVMYDSLNRAYLLNYGNDLVKLPNFQRLGEQTITFDNSYVGSLPCMPARRELHTGRLNFLHRGWSPVEPFDDSMPELLKLNGVYSHLCSDHQHYWEDGGATYHTRYQSWEIARGQEGDPWKGSLKEREQNTSFGRPEDAKEMPFFVKNIKRQDAVNRSYLQREEDFPQAQTFRNGLEFIEENQSYDNWFLQIETFDPHEPFFTPEEYQALYQEEGEAAFSYDWPPYGIAKEEEAFVRQVRRKYMALLSMCDHYLGKVLDLMDRYDMWKDTMLIVNTDHGYLLGEHLWWSKSVMPTYNEIAHTPLFLWDPRVGIRGERRVSLVQTIDLAPTILDFFGVPIPKDMQGKVLTPVLKEDRPVRNYALFGYFGSHINITDGRWLYMRAPVQDDNQPCYEYTLMPTDMRSRKPISVLEGMELAEPFSFTKGVRTMKLPFSQGQGGSQYRFGHKLFDLQHDPGQEHPIDDPAKEAELIGVMVELMRENDAPAEQYERVGIPKDGKISMEELLEQRRCDQKERFPEELRRFGVWQEEAVWAYKALGWMQPMEENGCLEEKLEAFLEARGKLGEKKPKSTEEGQEAQARKPEQGQTEHRSKEQERAEGKIEKADILAFAKEIVPEEDWDTALYTMETMSRLS